MRTDYAKKTPTKRKRAGANTRHPSSLLFMGLILGLLIGAGVYFSQLTSFHRWCYRLWHNSLIDAAATTNNKHANTVAIAPSPPQFSFYSVLPQGGEAPVTAIESTTTTEPPPPKQTPTKTTAAKEPSSSNPAVAVVNAAPIESPANTLVTTTNNTKSNSAPKTKYVLQVASLKNASVADKLRAELTLLGFSVNVTANQAANHTWYRVIIGPYNSIKLAQNDQLRLKQNKINALLKQAT